MRSKRFPPMLTSVKYDQICKYTYIQRILKYIFLRFNLFEKKTRSTRKSLLSLSPFAHHGGTQESARNLKTSCVASSFMRSWTSFFQLFEKNIIVDKYVWFRLGLANFRVSDPKLYASFHCLGPGADSELSTNIWALILITRI